MIRRCSQLQLPMVEVKFKFLQNISHYCNNKFVFQMHMNIIFVLSFKKFNITIHSNIKFMVIAYNYKFSLQNTL